jgi:hypothetical protein
MYMLADIDGGDVGGVIVLLMILAVVIPVLLASFIFWIWMLISAVQNKGLTEGEKIAWVLILVFVHILGAIIYFFVGHPKRNMPLAPPHQT